MSFMRITFGTQEDTYVDALGVLRRAQGRHVLVRKSAGTGRSVGGLQLRRSRFPSGAC